MWHLAWVKLAIKTNQYAYINIFHQDNCPPGNCPQSPYHRLAVVPLFCSETFLWGCNLS